jgi:hypothetical protein
MWDVSDGERRVTESAAPAAPLWVFVIGRNDARLLAELEAIFGDDPRVKVIEHSDLDHLLRPHGKPLGPPALPTR